MPPLSALPPTDTRRYFRPVGRALVETLERLPAESWDRSTVAGSWRVRDVVAHLSDTAMRRLSLHRDRSGPAPAAPQAAPQPAPQGESEIATLVNQLNASFVAVARRFSPRVLTDLYRTASEALADFFESVPLDAPGLFAVSWAGEAESAGWFDVAREFTEQWHHQAQIRDAVGAPPLSDPAWLRAVLETAVRGLPHAYRDAAAPAGTEVRLDVSGPSGGSWTLRRDEGRWSIWQGGDSAAAATVSLSDQDAWRLLFNALSPEQAARAVRVRGESTLAAPLLRARSVIL
jgi:uncharacterized protein (TIGR03083 family)